MSPQAGYYLPKRDMVNPQAQSMIERPDVPRSKFSGSWSWLATFNAGQLVPFLLDEVLPGDHMQYDVTAYMRMATPLFPIFSNQKIETFFFFVPNRLLWANWQKFMGEQANPADSIAFTIPQTTLNGGGNPGFTAHSLADYFGLPTTDYFNGTGINTNIGPISALPFRAYALIWNEWFRDENLQNSATFSDGDGPDGAATNLLQPLLRNKIHDYFTSALPWPQKFSPPVLPLTGFARVTGLAYDAAQPPSVVNAQPMFEAGVTPGQPPAVGVVYPFVWQLATATAIYMQGRTGVAGTDMPQVYADLSSASGTTINVLRQAWMLQQLLERDARGGTRYTEIVRSHFGVVSPDMRLQRPEYIGGGSSPLMVTPVAQTAPSAGVTVGALGAAATAVGQHRASYAATEHGLIIGLINVQTEQLYQDGVDRMWNRSTRYDFYWPSLAHLGEQAILHKELHCIGVSAVQAAEVFGYQERYQEYRVRQSRVVSFFRSRITGTLDPWHLGQRWDAYPGLSATFVQEGAPMARILAAGAAADHQQYLADVLIRRNATRPVPVFGTPLALGRF